jgi:hypothetical protein
VPPGSREWVRRRPARGPLTFTFALLEIEPSSVAATSRPACSPAWSGSAITRFHPNVGALVTLTTLAGGLQGPPCKSRPVGHVDWPSDIGVLRAGCRDAASRLPEHHDLDEPIRCLDGGLGKREPCGLFDEQDYASTVRIDDPADPQELDEEGIPVH